MYSAWQEGNGTRNAFPTVQHNLRAIASACWGDEQYGYTAVSYLADLERTASFSVYIDNAVKDVRVNTELPAGHIDVFEELGGRGLGRTDDPEEIRAAFCEMLNGLPLPFQFSVTQADFGHAIFRSLSTGLKVEKLAEYMGKSGLVAHSLRGSLGKSLDALNIAAGSAKQTVPRENNIGEWVQVRDLLERPSPLNKAQKRMMLAKTGLIAMRQFRTGLPNERGELVLEGPFDACNTLDSLQECAVLRGSLPVIRREFERGMIGRFLDEVIDS